MTRNQRRSALVACVVFASIARGTATADDVLLIPNSDTDNVMLFDPFDGTLIDDDYIADPGTVEGFDVFNRPLNAIDSGRGSILVSDQFRDVVLEFTQAGKYVKIFSNNGVRDTSVLDNIRGITLLPGGALLVANSGPSVRNNAHSCVRFDTAGVLVDAFVFERYGGIEGPFDMLVLSDRILVTSDGREHIAQYALDGKFLDIFSRGFDFPQQMTLTSANTIVVANFSAGNLIEVDMNGNHVRTLDPPGLSGFRGVIELGNGNLLVTSSTGVQEIDRTNGSVIATKFAGDEMRYIEKVDLPAPLVAAARAKAPAAAPTKSTRTSSETIRNGRVNANDERGLDRQTSSEPARARRSGGAR